MTAGTDALIQAWRDYVTNGIPASGANEPSKAEIRGGLTRLAVDIGAAQAGVHIEPTTAARDAYYADAENQSKLVYVNNNNGSATDPANGVYEYVSGAPRLAEGFYAGVAAVVQPLVDEAIEGADSSKAWAQSDTAPDPLDPTSKSAKVWAAVVQALFASFNIRTLAPETGYVFAIVDSEENAVVLITTAGKIIFVADPSSILPMLAIEGAVFAAPESNIWYGMADPTGTSMVWYIGYDGLLYANLASGAFDQAAFNDLMATSGLLPEPGIVIGGDSMSYDLGTTIAGLSGRTAVNIGRPSARTDEINAFYGFIPVGITLPGNTIPASGSVTVSSYSIDLLYIRNVSGDGTVVGKIGGVDVSITGTGGTATRGSATLTLTRLTAGSAVPISGNEPFVSSVKDQYPNWKWIVFYGRNNASENARILSDQLAVMDGITSAIKHVAFVGVCTQRQIGSASGVFYTEVVNGNRKRARFLPGRFFDLRAYMVENADEVAAAAGITLTADDLTDIAADAIPRSFFRDAIHFVNTTPNIEPQVNKAIYDFTRGAGFYSEIA